MEKGRQIFHQLKDYFNSQTFGIILGNGSFAGGGMENMVPLTILKVTYDKKKKLAQYEVVEETVSAGEQERQDLWMKNVIMWDFWRNLYRVKDEKLAQLPITEGELLRQFNNYHAHRLSQLEAQGENR